MSNAEQLLEPAIRLYRAGGKENRRQADKLFVEAGIHPAYEELLQINSAKLTIDQRMAYAGALGVHPDRDAGALQKLLAALKPARGESSIYAHRLLRNILRLLAQGIEVRDISDYVDFVKHFTRNGGTGTKGVAAKVLALLVGESQEPGAPTAKTTPTQNPPKRRKGTEGKIFIGHGHSQVWRELKDFLVDQLRLKYEEFNSEPMAGRSTKERLVEMLDRCCFGFLVMTGEDEHSDGTSHARENVIHEVGLLQGRYGFEKAIVLLEEGCVEFSNIHGVGQIQFPRNGISTQFEKIRRVLEREGVLPA